MPTATPTPEAATPPAGPPTLWQTVESPLFPSEWPPTPATTWVRYTFAYGSNPATLMDGAYVSPPLSRSIVDRSGDSGAATQLKDQPEAIDTQGVAPLTAPQQATLAKRAQVERYALQLTALPAASDETAALREYYQLWFRFNGAFVKQIRSNHAAFCDWIEGKQ